MEEDGVNSSDPETDSDSLETEESDAQETEESDAQETESESGEPETDNEGPEASDLPDWMEQTGPKCSICHHRLPAWYHNACDDCDARQQPLRHPDKPRHLSCLLRPIGKTEDNSQTHEQNI